MLFPARAASPATDAGPDRAPPGRRFRLMRFFTLTTLLVFAAAGAALFVLQRMEEDFFAGVQAEQRRFFAQAQSELARQHESAARSSLLAVHEASHVNLTRLVGNLMWEKDFGPFVAAAQRLPVADCRALPVGGEPRKACFAALGRRIRALPGFADIDRKAYAAMRASTVFKIKVFDLRGVTVYSSEPAQVGEDGSDNQGWKLAAAGEPASELTHRDRFSAFEHVVENRDLISSYVPVRVGPADELVGVFELYSDVTPFLSQIKSASQAFADISASNEASVARVADANQREVNQSSDRFLVIVGGLLVLLYGVSLVIVRIGQRIIDRQSMAQEQAARREELWHREKMAALAAMAANVSHEVGNPLAVIAGLAQDLPDGPAPDRTEPGARRQILEQTQRIARMMRKISDFAVARSGSPEWIEVNPLLEAVCEFHTFDRRFRRRPIDFVAGPDLPACEVVPDHLNEVMMNLLQASADVEEAADAVRGIRVRSSLHDGAVRIEVGGYCPTTGEALDIGYVVRDPRFERVRRRVADLGARLDVSGTAVGIVLPATAAAASTAAGR